MTNRQRLFLVLLWLMFVAILLTSCTPVSNLGEVKHQETPTPVHEWMAKPVLIKFGPLPSVPAPFWVIRGAVPQLLLYSDGSLFINKDGTIQRAQLTRQETCALLNTIEQSGFFDVDLSAYKESLKKVLIGESTFSIIEVNAWRSRSEVLELALDFPGVTAPLSLKEVVALLGNYISPQQVPYQFSQVAIVIHKYPANSPFKFDENWNVSRSLEQLFEQGTIKDAENSASVLEGDFATEVWDKISSGGGFTENGNQYAVSTRSLLPNEPLESALGQFTGPITSTVQLTCNPSDGVIDVR